MVSWGGSVGIRPSRVKVFLQEEQVYRGGDSGIPKLGWTASRPAARSISPSRGRNSIRILRSTRCDRGMVAVREPGINIHFGMHGSNRFNQVQH